MGAVARKLLRAWPRLGPSWAGVNFLDPGVEVLLGGGIEPGFLRDVRKKPIVEVFISSQLPRRARVKKFVGTPIRSASW